MKYHQQTKQLAIDWLYCNVNWYHFQLQFVGVHLIPEVLIIKKILSAYSFTEVSPLLSLGSLMIYCCFETVGLNSVLNSANWAKQIFAFGSVILVIWDHRLISLLDGFLILFPHLIYYLMVFIYDGFHFYLFS